MHAINWQPYFVSLGEDEGRDKERGGECGGNGLVKREVGRGGNTEWESINEHRLLAGWISTPPLLYLVSSCVQQLPVG